MEEGLGLAIFEAGDRIQRLIAGECLCLEATSEDSTISGTETYGLPDDFIAERVVRATNSSISVVKVNRDKYASLKRMLASDTSDESASNLFYYYIWGGEIGFLLSSGAAPTSEIPFQIDYWRYPGTGEKLSNTRDPVVDRRFDDCIYKGIVAEMTMDMKWHALYEESYQRAKTVEDARTTENLQIPVSDYD